MTPEALFEDQQPTVRALCNSLRALVLQTLPDLEEIVFGSMKNISYGTGASHADKDLICYIAPYTSTVNLGFYRGAILPDPHGLLSGTGKLLRHVKFPGRVQIDDPAVVELLRAALFERLGDRAHSP